MKLSYGQLELTLASHLQVHPDKVPTLRSRLKQLQRLQFPPGVNVGRGTKMEYTGEHLFMLVTAFELIGVGLPALTACTLAKEHWTHFSAGYALGALEDRRFVRDKGKESEQVLAILWIQSLHEIQFGSGWVQPRPSEVKICDETVAKRELRDYESHRHYTRVFLSIGAILNRVIKMAKERAGVDASPYDEDFHAWLPKGRMKGIDFGNRYPDRSNLELRVHLQQYYGNDPDCLTPDGIEEAQNFLSNNYSDIPPF